MHRPDDNISPFSASRTGSLYLVPSSLGEDNPDTIWPPGNLRIVSQISTFIVENVRTARRFLRKTGYDKNFDEVTFFLLNKHTGPKEVHEFLEPCMQGADTGLLSEAGTPCIADPGQHIVAKAHAQGIPVKPLTGPSSVLLALMASGMNGQQFSFHGYLPIHRAQRIKKMKELEQECRKSGATQIFMETPYRNNALLTDLVKHSQPRTKLCVAADLTMPSEYIRTMTIAEWRESGMPDLHKRPAMFLIG